MSQMTMNRAIHAAVLRDLDRIEAALREVSEGDTARLRALGRAWENLQDQLTRHHEGEDDLVWPMLRGLGADEALLAAMEEEHRALADGLRASRTAIDTAVASGSGPDAVAAADSVAATRAVVAGHLTHEEADLEPLLIAHADSPEWHAVEKQLRRQPPRVAGWFFAWLLDGASPEVESYVRSTVPAPVVFVLGRFFGNGYHRTVAPVWRV